MDEPYSTEGNALGSSLVCTALLDKLVAKNILTRSDVVDLLRNARNALGSGATRPAGALDAARLLDDIAKRYAAQSI
jgi:hypothetical protein